MCSLAGRYDRPIPTLFLASIDYLKFQHWSLLSYDEDIYSTDEGKHSAAEQKHSTVLTEEKYSSDEG